MGSGFLPTVFIACKVGDIVIPGLWISESDMMCVVPPLPPGGYEVEVTMNGQQYTQSVSMFLVYTPPVVLQTNTLLSSMDELDNTVIVYGAHFVNSTYLSCRFGTMVSTATFINTTAVSCGVPVLASANQDWYATLTWQQMHLWMHLFPDPTSNSPCRTIGRSTGPSLYL